MVMFNLNLKVLLKMVCLLLMLCTTSLLLAQIQATETKYIRIGSLQSRFSAYGSERAWNNSYYEGLKWPAIYPYQDNAVIERFWMATSDFTDAHQQSWSKYGVYFAASYVGDKEPYVGASLFPVELSQSAKFDPPIVYVDGRNITAPYAGDVDSVDPDQIPDRIVTNVVNTTMGLTVTRRILAFSQQYHDKYFIKEYIYTNTGNVDYDDESELNAPLTGVYITRGIRYSVSREGAMKFDNQQGWGKHSWVTKRGENYPAHAGDLIDESNPIVDWLRCGFSWAGQSERNSYDNIGAPDIRAKGRLAAPQHAGIVVLHVDKSAADSADDPNQPFVLGWHAGDTYPKIGNMDDPSAMQALYTFVSGTPYTGLGGNEKFDEIYLPDITSRVDPWKIHNDGGGTNVWISYGPFDIGPGESIRIVEAEAVSGLNREMCEKIGERWKLAYNNPSDTGPFTLPNGSTTSDKNIYKNTWTYTGNDSIMMTFGRAKRNFDMDYQIPQPPLPPPLLQINSGGDRINISWESSPSESESGFGGYRIFRGVGKPDTTYQEIFACGAGTDHPQIVNNYDDVSPIRGFSYYYYLVSFSDGSNNTTGAANPTGQLQSGLFYTRTTEPAFLRRKAGSSMEDIRIVPNPYNIRARDYNYPQEQDKIGFLNIPAYCTIKIYTERGDLIQTINHTDGSGDEYWNSITSSRQVVVSGLYIAYIEVAKDYNDPETGLLLYKQGENTFRKFIVIR